MISNINYFTKRYPTILKYSIFSKLFFSSSSYRILNSVIQKSTFSFIVNSLFLLMYSVELLVLFSLATF